MPRYRSRLGQFCRAVQAGGGASCTIAKPRPYPLRKGPHQGRQQHDKSGCDVFILRCVGGPNITVALAAGRLHARPADKGRSAHSIRRSIETYRGSAGANQSTERPKSHTRPSSRPAGARDGIPFRAWRPASRLVVGPVNNGACRASITVPGPADLPFRSGEASYQPLQASALS